MVPVAQEATSPRLPQAPYPVAPGEVPEDAEDRAGAAVKVAAAAEHSPEAVGDVVAVETLQAADVVEAAEVEAVPVDVEVEAGCPIRP